jgi:hypothetical protein
MKRHRLTLLAFSVLGTGAAHAQLAVTDPGAMAQRALHEGFNLTEYIYSAENTLNTYLTTYKQLVNQYEQMVRMGNVNAIKDLIGDTEIGQLASQTQQLYQQYAQIQNSFRPESYQNDLNNVLQSYRQPNWTGYVSQSGYRVAPNPNYYQFDTAITSSVDQALSLLDGVERQREGLLQKREQARQAFRYSSDDASMHKNGYALEDLNSAVAQNDQRPAQIALEQHLAQQKVQAAQRIAQKAQAERNLSEAQQAADQELAVLPSTGFHETTHWNN